MCVAALAVICSDDCTHESGLAVRIPERPVMAASCTVSAEEKNLIKNDMGIIKECFNLHDNRRT